MDGDGIGKHLHGHAQEEIGARKNRVSIVFLLRGDGSPHASIQLNSGFIVSIRIGEFLKRQHPLFSGKR
jgi:hypothetical protein